MNPFGSHLLNVITYLPMVGALIILVAMRESSKRTIARFAAAIAALDLLLALPLWIGWNAAAQDGFGFRFVHEANWIESIGVKYVVGVDGISRLTDFGVVFGPVRAADIPSFLQRGYQATPEMRRVTFGLLDRLEVAGLELAEAGRATALLSLLVLAVTAWNAERYSCDHGGQREAFADGGHERTDNSDDGTESC